MRPNYTPHIMGRINIIILKIKKSYSYWIAYNIDYTQKFAFIKLELFASPPPTDEIVFINFPSSTHAANIVFSMQILW